MKKLLLIVTAVCVFALMGCGGSKTDEAPEVTPVPNQEQSQEQTQNEGQLEDGATLSELEDLVDQLNQLDEVEDEDERRALLDQIQEILEQAEAQSQLLE